LDPERAEDLSQSAFRLICAQMITKAMSKGKLEKRKPSFEDCEPVHNGIGVTHWLPPESGIDSEKRRRKR